MLPDLPSELLQHVFSMVDDKGPLRAASKHFRSIVGKMVVRQVACDCSVDTDDLSHV